MRRITLLGMAFLAVLSACSQQELYNPALYQTGLPQGPATLSALPVYQGPAGPAPVQPKRVAREHWKNVGVDPYAHSREEAMAKPKREHAFRTFGLWGTCLAEALRVTAQPGAAGRLSNGDFIDRMESGHGVHHDVVLDSKKDPVLVTEEWTISCDKKTYRIVLPLASATAPSVSICFNWSLIEQVPAVPVAECREIDFNAVPFAGRRVARVRWTVSSVGGQPLPPSPCNAQKQNSGPWTAWVGQWCNCDVNFSFIRQILGPTAGTPHRQTYEVTAIEQRLRFDASIVNDVVQVCLEDEAGARTCGVYVRPQDWQGRNAVPIPDSLWLRSDGNCP